MIKATLTLPLHGSLVGKGLSGAPERPANPARLLSVHFGDGSLAITPQRPTVPARFSVAFNDKSLTIIP